MCNRKEKGRKAEANILYNLENEAVGNLDLTTGIQTTFKTNFKRLNHDTVNRLDNLILYGASSSDSKVGNHKNISGFLCNI